MVVVGSNHVATLTGWRQNNVCCNACNVLCHQLFVATCSANNYVATCCANNYVATCCATIFLVATRGKGSVVPLLQFETLFTHSVRNQLWCWTSTTMIWCIYNIYVLAQCVTIMIVTVATWERKCRPTHWLLLLFSKHFFTQSIRTHELVSTCLMTRKVLFFWQTDTQNQICSQAAEKLNSQNRTHIFYVANFSWALQTLGTKAVPWPNAISLLVSWTAIWGIRSESNCVR